ncbi:MAG TPA: Nif3-like dinuclear metal center hexameric protein [Bacteroidales bacterium]|nr:Nif3-like dinuclear metal center hexameric protein [Bacteroidales bacterium]
MTHLSSIIHHLESFAPLAYQESYDNSGLVVGDPGDEITGALLCVDVTMPVIEEAVKEGLNLIISHHPVIFSPLKQLTGKDTTQKIILEAVRNRIAIYCAHTNMDNVDEGVNRIICDKLGLINTAILQPQKNILYKLVTYVPLSHADALRNALFEAGAGHIGNYDMCSFNAEGKGTFRAGEGADPYSGEIGRLHFEDEVRMETIFPLHHKNAVVKALVKAHPYEEVAYDIYSLENSFNRVGSGMTGELAEPVSESVMLNRIKDTFKCTMVRHSRLLDKPVKKLAVCGGSGSFLIPAAIASGAQLFVTGEIKYHQFFEAEDKIVVADTGHYESEQFTIEIFYEILKKNLPTFAVRFSRINTSPIYYL